jgi:hypothetical protein
MIPKPLTCGDHHVRQLPDGERLLNQLVTHNCHLHSLALIFEVRILLRLVRYSSLSLTVSIVSALRGILDWRNLGLAPFTPWSGEAFSAGSGINCLFFEILSEC